jgi:hypothetical protein
MKRIQEVARASGQHHPGNRKAIKKSTFLPMKSPDASGIHIALMIRA